MRTDTMDQKREDTKKQILNALAHPEATDGLYFRNLYHLHEEDERDAVQGTQLEILDALKDLIQQKKVTMDESGEEAVFFLAV